MRTLLLSILVLVTITACQPSEQAPADKQQASAVQVADLNPAAEGFNAAESDPEAIALADSVMKAMGGRRAWDNTRFIRWNFFGRRQLTWDKVGNKVRIDFKDQDLMISTDLDRTKGWVIKDGAMVGDIKISVDWLKKARDIWINDSYWLVMPFKLKDSGVTLKYLGKDSTLDGKMAEVLQLTFNEVGVTPENKYKVYIDPETHLVNQWAFFEKAEDEEPVWALPWKDYKQTGEILLSGDRGKAMLSDVQVIDDLDPDFFNNWSIQ
ncbi:MAG: DUF6503 family protein [Bacteroidia bacterium]